jgi:hypothetical protein
VKPAKTSLSTFKQHVNSHGVPGGPEFDVGVFEIAQGCLQVVQPPTLSFIQFTASSQRLSVAPGSQRLAQTQFAHLEEVVRNFYDIIPENLFKIQALKTMRSSLTRSLNAMMAMNAWSTLSMLRTLLVSWQHIDQI